MAKYKTTKSALILASGLMLSAVAWADDGSLSMLVSNCISCHGPNGSSLGPATPTIAGLEPNTFVKIMERYKNGKHHSTIMGRIAKAYTTKDFKLMANYFANQPFVASPQSGVNMAKAKKGAKLHNEYCEDCHAKGGKVDMGATLLVGQWMPYLQFSLADFHNGIRDIPKVMQREVHKMVEVNGKESLEDVVHFYGSQTGQK